MEIRSNYVRLGSNFVKFFCIFYYLCFIQTMLLKVLIPVFLSEGTYVIIGKNVYFMHLGNCIKIK